MRKVLAVLALTLCAVFVAAQNPPTNAPQFQVHMNFFGGTPFNQASALDAAFTSQFTTNDQLRGDLIVMPAVGYTGYFGGPQYNLCAVSTLASLLSTTSLNCGKFMPYVNGAAGLGRIQVGTAAATQSLAGLIRAGANYDPTGSGKFSLNIFECGWGRFAHGASGKFCQTGFNIGLGSSPSATQAKVERMKTAERKKALKLQAQIQKAQQQK
jgi:hypothetical protein